MLLSVVVIWMQYFIPSLLFFQEFKLPIYASQTLYREMGKSLKSEIVGDLSLAFHMVLKNEEVGRSTEDLDKKQKSQAKIIKRFDSEIRRPDSEVQRPGPTAKPESAKRPVTSEFRRPVRHLSESSSSVSSSPTTSSSETKPHLFLRISSGRNFALHRSGHSAAVAPNLLIRSRLFSRDASVASDVKWQTTEPKFRLQSYVPGSERKMYSTAVYIGIILHFKQSGLKIKS